MSGFTFVFTLAKIKGIEMLNKLQGHKYSTGSTESTLVAAYTANVQHFKDLLKLKTAGDNSDCLPLLSDATKPNNYGACK
jgi:hypothetical protein